MGQNYICRFMIALVSGWVSHWGLTGQPQATAVTRVCLRFACVSYEALFFPGVLFLVRIIVGLWVLVMSFQFLVISR